MTESKKPGIRFLDFDDEANGILAYAIEGDLSDEEVAPVWARFEEAKEFDQKIRIYAEMSVFPKAAPSLVFEKLKRLGAIMSTVERLAIVGDAGWMELYAKIIDPITKPDIRHFSTEQKEEAVAWLRS
jgi:hypothetical protein